MSKLKFCFVLLIMLLLTGCTVDYNIYVGNDVIEENINIYANTNKSGEVSFQKYYLENDIESFQVNGERYYYETKTINNGNKTGTNLSFVYEDYSAYSLSRIFNECFKKSSIASNDSNVYIKASDFICYDYNYNIVDDAVINLTTNLEVVEHNADIVNNGVYTWNIIKNPKDITLVLKKTVEEEPENTVVDDDSYSKSNRDSEQQKEENTSWLTVVLILLAFFISIFGLFFYKMRKTQK